MHIPTHLMSGWVIGNQFSLSARQRGFCMLAASLADLDGLSLLFGQEAYWNYHHLLCHNLLFAVILSAGLAWPAPRRAASFLIFFSLAHVHLLLDFFGSGPGWPIYYLFPFSRYPMVNPHSWEFFSWQNMAVAGGAFWPGRFRSQSGKGEPPSRRSRRG